MDVHIPYPENNNSFRFVADDREHPFEPEEISKEIIAGRRLSETDKDFIQAVYDRQISFIDQSIRAIIDALEDKEILDQTLFVITADHGEEFWDHNGFEHGHTMYQELLHIPLIIYGHGVEPSERTDYVSVIDIAPTILGLAGIDTFTSQMQGIDLLSNNNRPGPDKERNLFAMGTIYGEMKYSLIDGGKKLILSCREEITSNNVNGEGVITNVQLYDLKRDPKETTDLHATEEETVNRMKETLFDLTFGFEATGESVQVPISEEMKKRLRAIGYTH